MSEELAAYVDSDFVEPLDFRGPPLEGLTIAGRYVPAGTDGRPTAGDFFDVVQLSGGCLLIAVGDVSGHGAGASGRRARLRAATLALAVGNPSTVEMLRRLDRLQGEGNPEDIATLWLGLFRPSDGLLRYASAGHLPPVVAFADGTTVLLNEATAPPLGTGVVSDLMPMHQMVLPEGAVLLAYSDGLVERPGLDLDSQLEVLRKLVHGGQDTCRTDGPAALVDLVLEELVPDPTTARDDVCVLVVQRT